MGEIVKYKIDIIKRTFEILNDHYPHFKDKDREVTFLMNCLLGLIVAIFENEKMKRTILKGNIDEQFLSLIPNKIGFLNSRDISENLTSQDLTQISLNVHHKDNLSKKDKYWFVNKIRNSIAHQNIEGINENGIWVGVRMWNSYNNKKDFEIVFQVDELKKFASELASLFIENE
ncbi:MAG: HEPN family nuclease [Bacteroidales bacterium]|jgi:hypothetical protein|nr:HEPN family nuclease [Bacteroidales bacterium]